MAAAHEWTRIRGHSQSGRAEHEENMDFLWCSGVFKFDRQKKWWIVPGTELDRAWKYWCSTRTQIAGGSEIQPPFSQLGFVGPLVPKWLEPIGSFVALRSWIQEALIPKAMQKTLITQAAETNGHRDQNLISILLILLILLFTTSNRIKIGDISGWLSLLTNVGKTTTQGHSGRGWGLVIPSTMCRVSPFFLGCG